MAKPTRRALPGLEWPCDTRVYGVVDEIVGHNKFNLLETVASRIAIQLQKDFEPKRVIVRVRKRIPPIPGNLDYIEVEYDSDTDAPKPARRK